LAAVSAVLWAAKRLARRPVDVLLIDRRNHHVFSPLLYQVATSRTVAGRHRLAEFAGSCAASTT
jgi:NADH dehydrogenase FAD-containing subunit